MPKTLVFLGPSRTRFIVGIGNFQPSKSAQAQHPSRLSFQIQSLVPQTNISTTWMRSEALSCCTRLYSTISDDEVKSEKALTDELRRLTQRPAAQGSTLGPFMMPRGPASERPLRKDEHHHWSQVSWVERGRRSLRMGRNLVVVGFGSCLGILVIYSIASELFAPSSSTNLMNSTIESLEESETLRKILKTPFRFHSSIPQVNSSKADLNGRLIELKFIVEGDADHRQFEKDWRSLEWWKSWIGPLITSEAYHRPLPEPSSDQLKSVDHQDTQWWPGLLKSLMPTTLRKPDSHGDRRAWSDRLFPSPGSFEHGEVTAEVIKDSKGKWTFKSLLVEFPDSHHPRYRLDVLAELSKKRHQQVQNGDQPNQTRYRFWSRRINVA